jgi:hypothetical protein
VIEQSPNNKVVWHAAAAITALTKVHAALAGKPRNSAFSGSFGGPLVLDGDQAPLVRHLSPVITARLCGSWPQSAAEPQLAEARSQVNAAN